MISGGAIMAAILTAILTAILATRCFCARQDRPISPAERWRLCFGRPVRSFCLIIAVALLATAKTVAQPGAPANGSTCPKNYYLAHARNQLAGVDSSVDYTVCIFLKSTTPQIDVRSKVTIVPTNAPALYQLLASKLISNPDCAAIAGLFSSNGWQIVSFDLNFQNMGGRSQVRIVGRARECAAPGFAESLRFTYTVPIRSSYTERGLAVSISAQEAKVDNVLFIKRQLGAAVSAALTEALTRINYDFSTYVPSFVRAFNPSVDHVVLAVRENRIEFQISAAGKLTGPAGDKLLFDATNGVDVETLFQMMTRKGPVAGAGM
jgi:hypothetical protein